MIYLVCIFAIILGIMDFFLLAWLRKELDWNEEIMDQVKKITDTLKDV